MLSETIYRGNTDQGKLPSPLDAWLVFRQAFFLFCFSYLFSIGSLPYFSYYVRYFIFLPSYYSLFIFLNVRARTGMNHFNQKVSVNERIERYCSVRILLSKPYGVQLLNLMLSLTLNVIKILLFFRSFVHYEILWSLTVSFRPKFNPVLLEIAYGLIGLATFHPILL